MVVTRPSDVLLTVLIFYAFHVPPNSLTVQTTVVHNITNQLWEPAAKKCSCSASLNPPSACLKRANTNPEWRPF